MGNRAMVEPFSFSCPQTLNSISAEKNSTIIFPLPLELISHFLPPRRS
jgi:hypothetical protein